MLNARSLVDNTQRCKSCVQNGRQFGQAPSRPLSVPTIGRSRSSAFEDSSRSPLLADIIEKLLSEDRIYGVSEELRERAILQVQKHLEPILDLATPSPKLACLRIPSLLRDSLWEGPP